MKIYICEVDHENDFGIYSTLEAALSHLDSCDVVQEYELDGDLFKPTELSIRQWECAGCGGKFRDDQRVPYSWFPSTCSHECCLDYEKRCAEFREKVARGEIEYAGTQTMQDFGTIV